MNVTHVGQLSRIVSRNARWLSRPRSTVCHTSPSQRYVTPTQDKGLECHAPGLEDRVGRQYPIRPTRQAVQSVSARGSSQPVRMPHPNAPTCPTPLRVTAVLGPLAVSAPHRTRSGDSVLGCVVARIRLAVADAYLSGGRTGAQRCPATFVRPATSTRKQHRVMHPATSRARTVRNCPSAPYRRAPWPP